SNIFFKGGLVKKLFLILFVLFFIVVTNAFAKDISLDAVSFHPAADGSGFKGLWQSSVLQNDHWIFGSDLSYAYRPFQLMNNGNRQDGIVDQMISQHFFASVGLIDQKFELGIELPIVWYADYKNPNVAGSVFESESGLGDARLNFKLCLWNPENHKLGIAWVPYITLPTGDSDHFLGSGVVALGNLLVIDGNISDKFSFNINAGILARDVFYFRDIEKTHQLLGGLGLAYEFTEKLTARLETNIKTRLSGLFEESVESPVEAMASLAYRWKDTGFLLNAGVGTGIVYGSEAPLFRGVLGLTYEGAK
ncbi:MAG TPA: transporter, partial [bacterium]|nr:transporter [bacterium]